MLAVMLGVFAKISGKGAAPKSDEDGEVEGEVEGQSQGSNEDGSKSSSASDSDVGSGSGSGSDSDDDGDGGSSKSSMSSKSSKEARSGGLFGGFFSNNKKRKRTACSSSYSEISEDDDGDGGSSKSSKSSKASKGSGGLLGRFFSKKRKRKSKGSRKNKKKKAKKKNSGFKFSIKAKGFLSLFKNKKKEKRRKKEKGEAKTGKKKKGGLFVRAFKKNQGDPKKKHRKKPGFMDMFNPKKEARKKKDDGDEKSGKKKGVKGSKRKTRFSFLGGFSKKKRKEKKNKKKKKNKKGKGKGDREDDDNEDKKEENEDNAGKKERKNRGNFSKFKQGFSAFWNKISRKEKSTRKTDVDENNEERNLNKESGVNDDSDRDYEKKKKVKKKKSIMHLDDFEHTPDSGRKSKRGKKNKKDKGRRDEESDSKKNERKDKRKSHKDGADKDSESRKKKKKKRVKGKDGAHTDSNSDKKKKRKKKVKDGDQADTSKEESEIHGEDSGAQTDEEQSKSSWGFFGKETKKKDNDAEIEAKRAEMKKKKGGQDGETDSSGMQQLENLQQPPFADPIPQESWGVMQQDRNFPHNASRRTWGGIQQGPPLDSYGFPVQPQFFPPPPPPPPPPLAPGLSSAAIEVKETNKKKEKKHTKTKERGVVSISPQQPAEDEAVVDHVEAPSQVEVIAPGEVPIEYKKKKEKKKKKDKEKENVATADDAPPSQQTVPMADESPAPVFPDDVAATIDTPELPNVSQEHGKQKKHKKNKKKKAHKPEQTPEEMAAEIETKRTERRKKKEIHGEDPDVSGMQQLEEQAITMPPQPLEEKLVLSAETELAAIPDTPDLTKVLQEDRSRKKHKKNKKEGLKSEQTPEEMAAVIEAKRAERKKKKENLMQSEDQALSGMQQREEPAITTPPQPLWEQPLLSEDSELADITDAPDFSKGVKEDGRKNKHKNNKTSNGRKPEQTPEALAVEIEMKRGARKKKKEMQAEELDLSGMQQLEEQAITMPPRSLGELPLLSEETELADITDAPDSPEGVQEDGRKNKHKNNKTSKGRKPEQKPEALAVEIEMKRAARKKKKEMQAEELDVSGMQQLEEQAISVPPQPLEEQPVLPEQMDVAGPVGTSAKAGKKEDKKQKQVALMQHEPELSPDDGDSMFSSVFAEDETSMFKRSLPQAAQAGLPGKAKMNKDKKGQPISAMEPAHLGIIQEMQNQEPGRPFADLQDEAMFGDMFAEGDNSQGLQQQPPGLELDMISTTMVTQKGQDVQDVPQHQEGPGPDSLESDMIFGNLFEEGDSSLGPILSPPNEGQIISGAGASSVSSPLISHLTQEGAQITGQSRKRKRKAQRGQTRSAAQQDEGVPNLYLQQPLVNEGKLPFGPMLEAHLDPKSNAGQSGKMVQGESGAVPGYTMPDGQHSSIPEDANLESNLLLPPSDANLTADFDQPLVVDQKIMQLVLPSEVVEVAEQSLTESGPPPIDQAVTDLLRNPDLTAASLQQITSPFGLSTSVPPNYASHFDPRTAVLQQLPASFSAPRPAGPHPTTQRQILQFAESVSSSQLSPNQLQRNLLSGSTTLPPLSPIIPVHQPSFKADLSPQITPYIPSSPLSSPQQQPKPISQPFKSNSHPADGTQPTAQFSQYQSNTPQPSRYVSSLPSGVRPQILNPSTSTPTLYPPPLPAQPTAQYLQTSLSQRSPSQSRSQTQTSQSSGTQRRSQTPRSPPPPPPSSPPFQLPPTVDPGSSNVQLPTSNLSGGQVDDEIKRIVTSRSLVFFNTENLQLDRFAKHSDLNGQSISVIGTLSAAPNGKFVFKLSKSYENRVKETKTGARNETMESVGNLPCFHELLTIANISNPVQTIPSAGRRRKIFQYSLGNAYM